MKQFLLLVVKAFVLLYLIAWVLDLAYTQVYLHSSKRGKVEAVFNGKPKKYDVVILGTSRANNHFVPELFEKKGLKTFNYGMSGSHLFETSLLLELMIERKFQMKCIILEADLSLSNDKRDEGTTARYLPFLHHSKAIANHFRQEKEFYGWCCIPFYRYIEYDSQIGFREMYESLLGKTTSNLDNGGYYPLHTKNEANMKNNYQSLNPLHNKYYEKIKQICKSNNIRLITVTTPVCENVKGMDYFQKVTEMYPEIHNLENFVQGDEYFSSCGHLNDKGARLFTQKVINLFFSEK
ncbi:hypothetical protein [Flavobacterium psychrotolerans]|uniref:SGNH/GDSL hydrolase family protein n=1 Tax=Flavobacterium psychrotolerans TaxID=2169410 RepID=A0A2U1JJ39_9FLAO|nr:hypothetical protein [Flavobacterium psychrotolerans]PWA05190.1 hypothetical protein DB895_07745 [Flavobacterium psychrotolerans]